MVKTTQGEAQTIYEGQKPPIGGGPGITPIWGASGDRLSGGGLANQAVDVNDPNARIGDYVVSNGRAVVVPNSKTDYAQRYKQIRGGSESFQYDSNGKFVGLATAGVGLGSAGAIASTAAKGAAAAGPLGVPLAAGLTVYTAVSGTLADIEARHKAIEAWKEQEVEVELPVTFDETNKTATVDLTTATGLDSRSGSDALAAQNKETSVSLGDDGRLKIDVSPAFANTATFQELVERISNSYGGLTKDTENFDKIIESIKDNIDMGKSQFDYEMYEYSQYKLQLPSASDEYITKGYMTQLAGYQSEETMEKYDVTVIRDGQEVTKTAKEVLDEFYNKNKDERSDYVIELQTKIDDPNISDDEKALALGEYSMISAASNNDRNKTKYHGMLNKSIVDTFMTEFRPIFGVSLANIMNVASFGNWYKTDQLGLKPNDAAKGFALLTGTAINVYSTNYLQNTLLENTIIRNIPVVKSFASWTPNSTLAYAVKEIGTDFAINVVSDGIYDIAQTGVSVLGGREDDFWGTYVDNLGQDLIMDYIVSGISSVQLAGSLARRPTGTAYTETNSSAINDAVLKNDSMYGDETKIRDVKYDPDGDGGGGKLVNTEEVGSKIAKKLGDLEENPAVGKVRELFFDKNEAITAEAMKAYGETADRNLYLKGVESSNDIRRLTGYEVDKINSDVYVKGTNDTWRKLATSVYEFSPKGKFTKTQISYMVAADELARYSLEFKGDEANLKIIREFYQPYIDAVPAAQRVQLDGIMGNLKAWLNKVGDSYVKSGVGNAESLAALRDDDVFKEVGWAPLWGKKESKLSLFKKTIISDQIKKTSKNWLDVENLYNPEAFENPINSGMKWASNIANNIAVNERNKVIIELADAAGDIRHTVSDPGAVADKIVENYSAVEGRYNSITEATKERIRKQVPTQAEYRKTHEQIIKKSGFDGAVEDYINLPKQSNYRGFEVSSGAMTDNQARAFANGGELDGKTYKVVEMSPDQYLRALVGKGKPYKSMTDVEAKGAIPSSPNGGTAIEYAAAMQRGSTFPLTYIDYTDGKVNFQEGIHRALAAKQSGVETMPVVIQYSGSRPNILNGKIDITDSVSGKVPAETRQYAIEQTMLANGDTISYDVVSEDGMRRTTYGTPEKQLTDHIRALAQMNRPAHISGELSPEDIRVFDDVYARYGDAARRASRGSGAPRAQARNEAMALGVELDNLVLKSLPQTATTTRSVAINNIQNEAFRIVAEAASNNKLFRNEGFVDTGDYLANNLTPKLAEALRSDDPKIALNDVLVNAMQDVNPYISYEMVLSSAQDADATEFRTWLEKNVRIGKNQQGNKDEIITAIMAKLANDTGDNYSAGVSVKAMTDKNGGVVTYFDGDNKKQSFFIKGEIGKRLARLANDPNTFVERGVLDQTMRRFANMKRLLTTGIDPTRALPNFARDIVHGGITSGGDMFFDAKTLLRDLMVAEGFSEAEIARINSSLDIALNRVKGETLNASLETANKFRGKELSRAAVEMNETKATRYIWDLRYDKTGLLKKPMDFFEGLTRGKLAESAYTRSLYQTSGSGMSLDQRIDVATREARFAGTEFTTNFPRKGRMIETVAGYVPYFAQNFSNIESFKLAFVADPVGVGSNLAGFMLAYVYLLSDTLANEASRKNYYNLTEYDRANNIIISIDQETIMTIPLDESVAGFVFPWRRLIETWHNVDPTSFMEVVFGGLLEMGPLDLSGFSEGDTFNLQRGFERLGSQMLPTMVTGVGQALTGRNWYYGSDIAVTDDTLAAYGNYAPTPGDYTTTGKNSKTLAAIANATGIPQWQLQSLVEQFTGNVGQYALNALDKLSGATEEEQGGKEFVDAIFKSFTGMDSQNVQSQFYNGINQLQKEKGKLLNELDALNGEMSAATGQELINLQNKYQQKKDDYAVKVADFVSQYLNAYEITGGLSYKQAMQVYWLFRLDNDRSVYEAGSVGEYYNTLATKQAANEATEMAAPILDRYYNQTRNIYQNASGEWKVYSPYGERAYYNTIYGQGVKHEVGLRNILEGADSTLKNARTAMYARRNAAYAAGDWDEYEKAGAEFDQLVVDAIAPYINRYGAENVLGNSTVLDYLESWFIVPSKWMTNKYGKSVSLAHDASKQRAFVRPYIKYLFGLDTGYNSYQEVNRTERSPLGF